MGLGRANIMRVALRRGLRVRKEKRPEGFKLKIKPGDLGLDEVCDLDWWKNGETFGLSLSSVIARNSQCDQCACQQGESCHRSHESALAQGLTFAPKNLEKGALHFWGRTCTRGTFQLPQGGLVGRTWGEKMESYKALSQVPWWYPCHQQTKDISEKSPQNWISPRIKRRSNSHHLKRFLGVVCHTAMVAIMRCSSRQDWTSVCKNRGCYFRGQQSALRSRAYAFPKRSLRRQRFGPTAWENLTRCEELLWFAVWGSSRISSSATSPDCGSSEAPLQKWAGKPLPPL